MTAKGLLIAAAAAVLLLSAAAPQHAVAAVINGSSSLCQCTPRTVTTSTYLDTLNSYTTDMISLLSQISAQLTSLGLKYSDFPSATLAKLLQLSGANAEATKVANALLASLNSSSSSSSGSLSSAVNCTAQDSLTFFGSAVYAALGSGVTYSGGKWTLALSGATLTVDYGVKSCSSVTQFVQQVCVDGYPSQVYIFIQANATAAASLVTDSLTASSQSGAVCVTINQYIMAFTILPRALKSLYSLMPNYQFNLTVAGCFSALSANCTPAVAPTTVTPCTSGNALVDITILPVDFFYNVQLSRIDGTIINATANGTAASTFLADLTADGCRAEPNVTQVCAAGNFKHMKIGRLTDYQGTIQQFPGSENVTATTYYQRFCYNVNSKMAILAIQPADLFYPTDTQFKFFPEARGCYDPVTSSCVARPACVGPLEVGWQSDQLPQQSFTASNVTYTGGQWLTTGSDASLAVDFSAGGCRKSAAVTKVCVTSSNATQVLLSAVFPVGEKQFSSENTLSGSSPPSVAAPWCQTYSAAPTMLTLYISFPTAGDSRVSLRWTINGCFSTLPAYCLTTTAAPTTTVATTTSRPAEACSVGFPTLTNASSDLPAAAISGGIYAASSRAWTVAKGNSLTLDLTVGGCRQSARLLAICILGNAATVRIDYVLEDNSRVILGDSATASQPAAGVALCFSFPSPPVYSKSLVLLPTALKTASAGDTAYSLMVNLSACFSAVSASCYSPVCSCSSSYRPVFYSKKYYKIAFKVTSGYYSTYKSTYATPITTDYQDLLNMTDTMIWQSFGDYKDKYEGIDQVAFTSGSVKFDARLIMYDGGYAASGLTSALSAGMSSYATSGSYVVDASSITITDYDTTTTTSATLPLSTSSNLSANATSAPAVGSPTAVDLGLLLGLLIPLIVVLILVLVLSIMFCKNRRRCCFANSANSAVTAGVRSNVMQESATATSTAELIDHGEDPTTPPPSAREGKYQYPDGDGGAKDHGLPMPEPAVSQSNITKPQVENESPVGQLNRPRNSITVTPLPGSVDDLDGRSTSMDGVVPLGYDRRSTADSLATRPNTPRTVTIETFTYQLRRPTLGQQGSAE